MEGRKNSSNQRKDEDYVPMENWNNKDVGCWLCRMVKHETGSCPGRNSHLILTEKANEKIEEGPSAADGNGFIYIYKDKAEGDDHGKKGWFKIGTSSAYSTSRIEQSEKTNKKKYVLLYVKPTTFHGIREKIIHAQLEHFRRKKKKEDCKDGRTEWFMGDLEYFKETIESNILDINWEKCFIKRISVLCEMLKENCCDDEVSFSEENNTFQLQLKLS